MKICIPTSSGGHLTQVMALKPWWCGHSRFFVTYQTPDVQSLLKNEKKYTSFGPEHHNGVAAFLNFFLALVLLVRERPSLVFSFGAGIAAPFYWAAWLLRVPSLYIEPYDFVSRPSLTARLVSFFASTLLVQHKSLRSSLRNSCYWGSVL